MALLQVEKHEAIRALVRGSVEAYASGFKARHQSERDDPEGTINMKIHNVFIAVLGEEIQYYTALVRSLDSSLGNMLEGMAMNIARLTFEVKRSVEGNLALAQTTGIAELLEQYKRHVKVPQVSDYQFLRDHLPYRATISRRHDSDYYLIDRQSGNHYLIELKIGGDLDNKKARSEKEALLEQFAILCNGLRADETVTMFFATAYNRFGEGRPWRQERVRQFFADDELLIGKTFGTSSVRTTTDMTSFWMPISKMLTSSRFALRRLRSYTWATNGHCSRQITFGMRRQPRINQAGSR